jgi:hypothetical protein
MLNSWELVCMVICKHIQGLQSLESFYNFSSSEIDEIPTRMDDSRLALIVLTKLFEYLQYMKVDPLIKSNQVEGERYKDLAEQTLLIINMYFVEQVLQEYSMHHNGRF